MLPTEIQPSGTPVFPYTQKGIEALAGAYQTTRIAWPGSAARRDIGDLTFASENVTERQGFCCVEEIKMKIRHNRAWDKIGEPIEGGASNSLMFGPWAPRDHTGRMLNNKRGEGQGRRIYTVIVSRDVFPIQAARYKEAEEELLSLKDIDGFGTMAFQSTSQMYKTLRKDEGIGRWFFLPLVLANGTNFYRKEKVFGWNLHSLYNDEHHTSALKSTIQKIIDESGTSLFGTSTPVSGLGSRSHRFMCAADVVTGADVRVGETNDRPLLNFLLCRLEEYNPRKTL